MDWYYMMAVLLIVLGFIGLLAPLLPGIVFIFCGLLLAAWSDDFTRVSGLTMTVIGVVTFAALAIDFVASYLTVKKANASQLARYGTLIGAIMGLFGGMVGLIIGPIIGAMMGELIARNNSEAAARVGMAAGMGFILALVARLLLAGIMMAIFAYSYFY